MTHDANAATKDGFAAISGGFEQMQAAMQKAMKTAGDLFSFSQGNVEAITRSTQIFATGLQDIGQTLATSTKASMEDTMGTVKAMAGVKSFKEAVDLQSQLMRGAMEKAVSQAGQLADSTIKLSEQSWAPLGARVSLATEKFGRLA